MLIIFILLMSFVFFKGKKLLILPILFIVGVVLTISYEPNLRHRYLCFYGIYYLSFRERIKKGYEIDESQCIKCGLCKKECPADAVSWNDRKNLPI